MSTTAALTPIAPVDLAAERAALGEALYDAVRRVLDSGKYVLGPEVEALERDFARMHGCAHGVAVGTGTDALWLGLLAVGVKPCDSVVTSPFTFFASAASIALMGATVRLADVDYDTALLDVDKAEAAIDARTTAILPVHLYGQLADVRAFRALCDKRKLALLEDGAQAHGSLRDGFACGQLGDAGTFSFYVTKNLGAAGEGGMVLTQRADVAQNLRQLRDHGSPTKYVHTRIGTNSRLQALQAAILNVKLPHLERAPPRTRRALLAQLRRARRRRADEARQRRRAHLPPVHRAHPRRALARQRARRTRAPADLRRRALSAPGAPAGSGEGLGLRSGRFPERRAARARGAVPPGAPVPERRRRRPRVRSRAARRRRLSRSGREVFARSAPRC
jgi:dTDP-4-amino-4,6-dideoxygalactose transaminase